MNTNKLKVTDLMVGDWVMSFGEPHKIVGVRTFIFGPYIKFDMSDTWYEEGIENLLEPIPLTKELLEKNGFEWIKNKIVDEAYVLTKTFWDEEPELIIRRFDFNESFVICTSWDDTSFMCIGYVHELQHLLKLCKIDKEIIV